MTDRTATIRQTRRNVIDYSTNRAGRLHTFVSYEVRAIDGTLLHKFDKKAHATAYCKREGITVVRAAD